MEPLLVMAAIALGWILSVATQWLLAHPSRREESLKDKRQVYARLLAMSAALVQSAGYIINWESERGRPRTGAAAVQALNDLVRQMETGIVATRQLVAEVRLIGGAAIADEATTLSRVAEHTVLLIRYQPSITVWRREWPILEGQWRETVQTFERLARSELGTPATERAGWLARWRRGTEA